MLYFNKIIKKIFLLVFFIFNNNTEIKSQTYLDTLYLFTDTTTFINDGNGLILDWMSNFAIKFDYNNEYYTIKKVGFLFQNIYNFKDSVNFNISLGSYPEQLVLYSENLLFDSTLNYFPKWQYFDLKPNINLHNYSDYFSFYISGNIILNLATTHWSDTILNNHFIYHAFNKNWIEGVYKYWPISVVVEKNLSSINLFTEVFNEFALIQNYPNPFNPSTEVRYQITEGRKVSLIVYDVLGNEVVTLVNENQAAGNYSVEFNSSKINGLTSGVYFYTLRAGEFVETKKMLLMK